MSVTLLAALLLAADAGAAAAPATYRVTGVERGDTLKVRKRADPASESLADLPAGQRGLLSTGRTETVGRSVWREINLAGRPGWVNDRFLQVEEVTPSPDLKCGNSEPAWWLEILGTGAVKGDDALALPPSVRVQARELAAGRRDVWYLELGAPGAARLVSVVIKETGACRDASGARFRYEVYAKRDGGEFLPGCCNRLGPAKKAQSSAQ